MKNREFDLNAQPPAEDESFEDYMDRIRKPAPTFDPMKPDRNRRPLCLDITPDYEIGEHESRYPFKY